MAVSRELSIRQPGRAVDKVMQASSVISVSSTLINSRCFMDLSICTHPLLIFVPVNQRYDRFLCFAKNSIPEFVISVCPNVMVVIAGNGGNCRRCSSVSFEPCALTEIMRENGHLEFRVTKPPSECTNRVAERSSECETNQYMMNQAG